MTQPGGRPPPTSRVAVVIAAYNCGPDLRPSLASALAQDHPDLEVVLVDDGSDDGSVDAVADLCADPRVTLIRQPNAGKAAALNAAVASATADYLMIQDGDDLSEPDRASRLAAALDCEPDLGGVMSRHWLLVEGRRIAPRRRPADRRVCAEEIAAFRQPAHDPTLMFRRSAVAGDPFDTELRIGQGVDLVLRVGEAHPLRVLGTPLYSYRVDRTSTTRRDPARTKLFTEQVVGNACRRRGVEPASVPPIPAPPAWPVGHAVDATLDARLLDGRRAAARVLGDVIAVFGVRWPWWRAAAYAVAPLRMVRSRRPDALVTADLS